MGGLARDPGPSSDKFRHPRSKRRVELTGTSPPRVSTDASKRASTPLANPLIFFSRAETSPRATKAPSMVWWALHPRPTQTASPMAATTVAASRSRSATSTPSSPTSCSAASILCDAHWRDTTAGHRCHGALFYFTRRRSIAGVVSNNRVVKRRELGVDAAAERQP